ncbi:MAG: hypothetical protein KDD70_18490, partial [Bdellovibrionales bacterium]|nr:hypothetical protein [Bdellovibrionales bacterium]
MLRDQGYRAGAPLAKQGGFDLSATSISSPLVTMAQGSSFSSTGAGSGSFQPNLFEGAALHQMIFDTLVEAGVRMPPTREPLATIRTPNDLYERLLYIAEPRVPHGDKPMLLSRTGEFRLRGEVPTWRETERVEEALNRVERFFDRFDDRLRELDKTRPLSVHTFFQTYCAFVDISTALVDFGRKHLPEGSDVREAIEAHEGTAAWYMRTGLRYEAARRLSGNSHFLPESIRSGLTHYVGDLNLDHDGDNTSLALTEHIQLCIEREKEASRLFCNYVKDNPTSELATVIAAAAGNSLWKGMTPSDDMKSTLFRTYSNALHMSLNRTQSGFVRVSEDQLNLMAGIAELQPDEWKRRIGLEIQRGNWAVEGRVFATGALAAGTGVDRQTRHGMVTMLLSQWDDVLDNFGTAKPIPVQKLPDPLCTFLSTPISQSSVPVDQQFLSRLSKGGGFADRYMDLRIEADR